jgi:putative hydrolase of the HAD superfamily
MVLIAGVERTLRVLYPSTRLVLVTKGDPAIQQHKIDTSGLVDYLDASYIVGEKNADTYRRIVAELDLDPTETWMVGNSPRSDINPAIEAGLGAILVPHDHTWTAEQEPLAAPELVVTLASFGDLLPFFGVEPSE